MAERNGEKQLVYRARGGDRTAFDRLIHRVIPPLRGFLGKRVAREAVDDVVQETLLAAWAGLPDYEPRPQATFQMWLYRIARNKAVDWVRGNARHTAHVTGLDDIAERALPASDPAGALESGMMVQRLLEALTQEQRTVIELYYTQGLTLAEIAAEQGRNLSTVKYHFYRAQEIMLRTWREEME